MSSYLGYEVLDTVTSKLNRDATLKTRLHRGFVLLDTGTGEREGDEHAAAPNAVRPLKWSCRSRADVATLRAFLDTRKGSVVPIWVPSFQRNLTLSENMAQNTTIMNVEWVGYLQQAFGTTGARRHLAVYDLMGAPTMTFHKVTAATDPGTGLTESLTITPATPRIYPKETTIICYMLLCRLDKDLTEIEWHHRDAADAILEFRELPLEAPV